MAGNSRTGSRGSFHGWAERSVLHWNLQPERRPGSRTHREEIQDESTIKGASNFYINVLGSLQDISESLQYISKVTFKHINNNHKALTFNQIRELKEISLELETLFERTKFAFSKNNFKEISSILDSKQELLDSVREKINNQISRTKSEESSPKNTTLYFSILTESKDLIKATMAMLELYNDQYDSSVEPPLNDE